MQASDEFLAIAHGSVVIDDEARYTCDCAVERSNREALLYTIGERTNDINRLITARKMKGDDEMAYWGLIS